MMLKNKVERVFYKYLVRFAKSGRPLARMSIVEAHSDDVRTLPVLEIWAGSETEREDIPQGSGEFNVKLELRLMTQADDEGRFQEDSRVGFIYGEMADLATIKAFANHPNGRRPVSAFYVQDVIYEGTESGAEDRAFVETLIFNVVCRNDDGQGS